MGFEGILTLAPGGPSLERTRRHDGPPCVGEIAAAVCAHRIVSPNNAGACVAWYGAAGKFGEKGMRAVITTLLFLVCAAAAQAEELMSPRAFRDVVIAQVRLMSPTSEIEILDEHSFSVEDGNTVFLNNAYSEYRASPERAHETIERYARLAVEDLELPADRSRIVAVLRHREFVDSARQISPAPDAKPIELVWRPFAGDLVVLLAFDSEETVAFATREKLDELGLTVDQAWNLAPANLPARMGDLVVDQVEKGLLVVSGGNGLAPSHLTEPGLCALPDADGRMFLLLDRGSYLEGRPDEADVRDLFRALVSRLASEGGTASRTPLECRSGRLVESAMLGRR
jgi:hypothetical protein